MKYIPAEESEEINSKTEKNPLFNVSILVLGFATFYLGFLFILGILGETLAAKIPPRYEQPIFSFIDLKIEQKPWDLGNQIVNDIFKNNSVDEEFKPEVFISCSNTVNAVALPGKKIIVFKGLVDNLKSLNSLYFVLGHEIGHVINRDHLKSMGRALAISVGLFFINASVESNSFFSLNQALLERRFSQIQEEASDERATEFTIKRFNGLSHSHEFFDRIVENDPTNAIGGFLSTHPLTKDRLDKIKKNKNYNLEETKLEKIDSSSIPCSMGTANSLPES